MLIEQLCTGGTCPVLKIADEIAPKGFNDAKDRLPILGCANAAGTHKVKLTVIGKSQCSRYLKGV